MKKTLEETLKETRAQRLTSLILTSYKLTEFPEEILDFEWLEELIFGFYYNFETGKYPYFGGMCALKSLPVNLNKLGNLKTLSLSGSPFGGAKPEITNFAPLFELESLEYLYLDGTKITEISKIGMLPKLKHLNLAMTEIKDFTPIAQLTELECLTLGDNNIEHIDFLTSLKKIKALSLTTNKLTTISPLAKISTLKRLCVCKNLISDFTPLEVIKDIYYLCCCNNHIENYEFLARLPNLEEISASTQFTYQDLKDNIYLKTVMLGNVSNKEINEISSFKNCTMMSLTGNFTEFSLSESATLETLSLESSELQHISLRIGLNNLKNFYVTGNFESISGLADLPKLTRLSINSNQFSNGNYLESLQLEELTIKSTALDDLTFLEKHQHLKNLYLYNANTDAIQPLGFLSHLEYLHLENIPLMEDLTPISNLKHLKTLVLYHTGVKDLLPLLSLLEKEDFEMELSDNQVPDDLLNIYYDEGKTGLINYYKSVING